MEASPNYLFIWLVYLTASAVFFWVYWRLTAFRNQLWLSCSLRALMLALVLTPWYANTQGDVYAPALMVLTLDAITLGLDTMGRALTPLILSLLAAELVATVAWLFLRRKKKLVKTGS